MAEGVTMAIRPDIVMEDSAPTTAHLSERPPIVVRQPSANSFFEVPTAQPAPFAPFAFPACNSSCQPICTPAPALLQLRSLLGARVGIPFSSVSSLADLQAVATRIYGIPPSMQRILLGSTELTPAVPIGDALRAELSGGKVVEEVPVRVFLALPPPLDPDSTLGAFRVLPTELCISILSLLSVADVCSFSRTCKRLREVASDSKLWFALYCRYWCPLSLSSDIGFCWKEVYKCKLERLQPQSCEERRTRDEVKAMLAAQAKLALACSSSMHPSPVNLGLLEACARRAIQFGAPAYNRRDFEACYRAYFSITAHILSVYGEFPRMSPLFRRGLCYLRNSVELSRNAPDDSRRAWSYRHGFDSILLMANLQRAAIKSTLNLGETYCARHMWAEAEASIKEALDMSFEARSPVHFTGECDAAACHNYNFFMYVHCLLMQGKYVEIIMQLKDSILRGALGRLRVQCFRHTTHFVCKGLSAIDECLGCPHITCPDRQKLMLIRLYYVFVGSPTAAELTQAINYCAITRRTTTLACVQFTVSYFAEALAKVEPLRPAAASSCAEAEGEGGDEGDEDEDASGED